VREAVPLDDWTATLQARNRYLAERDAARADADRLAASASEAADLLDTIAETGDALPRMADMRARSLRAALAAHDAARAEEGL